MLNLKNNSDPLWAETAGGASGREDVKAKVKPEKVAFRMLEKIISRCTKLKISNVVPKTGTLSQITAKENSVYQQLSVGKMK